MSDAITTKGGRVWIQPYGPGNPVYPLSCKNLGDLTEPLGGTTPLRCFNDAGDGWDVVGRTEAPPESITTSVETLLFEDRDWLESVKCDYSLYVLSRDCGRADVFANYVRGEILTRCHNTQRTYSNLVHKDEDTPSTLGVDIEAWPPLIDITPLKVDRLTTTGLLLGWNDIYGNPERRCTTECGATVEPGYNLVVASDSAPAAADADFIYSNNGGTTFAAAAVDPFAAHAGGLHVQSAVRFMVGRSQVRWLCASSDAGAQGMASYSDNGGASWTVVNIGGAAAGHGPTYGGGLWVNGERFVLMASAAGYIYKSVDAGETWTAVEGATITAGAYKQVKATSDNVYCIAGAPADIIALSDDGGDSWYAASATGGGGDILTVWRFDKNRMMVGTDDGTLWSSSDGGVTWVQITGWTGSGVGDVRDIWFVNDHVGFMAYDTAAPVGSVLRTINGGADWEVLTTPANSGLNKIWAPTTELAFVVGEINGGVAFAAKVTAA